MSEVGEGALSDSIILEKLQEFLGNQEAETSKNIQEETITIFESINNSLATGWSLLDDDFEICMMSSNAKDKFTKSFPGIDFNNVENMSMNTFQFADPRLLKIYKAQWGKVRATGNQTYCRFSHKGVELFSHMFPFNWHVFPEGTRTKEFTDSINRLNAAFDEVGFVRYGRNTHLKYGDRMEKCVMHSVSRHPTLGINEEGLNKSSHEVLSRRNVPDRTNVVA